MLSISWKSVRIEPEAPIMRALEIISEGALGVALVVNGDDKLLGVVTDGDVRRGLLRHISLDAQVQEIMCTTPTVARDSDSQEHIMTLMRTRTLHHIPVLDFHGRVVGLEWLKEMTLPTPRDNWVVLMAGGLGSRLGELTRDCPKPLLHVGKQPILELIIENFVSYGFHKFYLAVNYKKEMIKSYFGDGSRMGVRIEYLEEQERLGTAGPLSLMPEAPKEPFFVMNGDLLTRIHFGRVLDYHMAQKADATMCVRQVEETLPYGVVDLGENHRLNGITEKPVNKYFVNTGIYLLEPSVLPVIPQAQFFDMPDLFRTLAEDDKHPVAFPFLEYWMDIGQVGDFHQACQDVEDVF
ncbi:nucleotidyltransferase family protein [Magnetococcus sp. PR-3]|uniref:nucleotidyltransferase family protein n=1 Tax=Magnetococcus sp. PR-3 TaxID=3120355 RepID=UPI002FCE1D46